MISEVEHTLGTQPSAMAIFQTCVSTGKSCRPRQNMSTHEIVLAPTPL
jgi:hypothetical protein